MDDEDVSSENAEVEEAPARPRVTARRVAPASRVAA
jgi:hypothetical protein